MSYLPLNEPKQQEFRGESKELKLLCVLKVNWSWNKWPLLRRCQGNLLNLIFPCYSSRKFSTSFLFTLLSASALVGLWRSFIIGEKWNVKSPFHRADMKFDAVENFFGDFNFCEKFLCHERAQPKFRGEWSLGKSLHIVSTEGTTAMESMEMRGFQLF